MSQRQIKLTIDSCLDDVFLVGLATSKTCSYIRMTELECYQMEVSVVEAVTNVIKHSYGGESGHDVEVVVKLQKEQVVIEVTDTGKPLAESDIRITRDARAQFDFDRLSDGGRGLFIMGSYMDEMGYHIEDGRNTLTLVKSRVVAQV